MFHFYLIPDFVSIRDQTWLKIAQIWVVFIRFLVRKSMSGPATHKNLLTEGVSSQYRYSLKIFLWVADPLIFNSGKNCKFFSNFQHFLDIFHFLSWCACALLSHRNFYRKINVCVKKYNYLATQSCNLNTIFLILKIFIK